MDSEFFETARVNCWAIILFEIEYIPLKKILFLFTVFLPTVSLAQLPLTPRFTGWPEWPYSLCRQDVPDNQTAKSFDRLRIAINSRPERVERLRLALELRSKIEELSGRRLDSFSPIESEAYMHLLVYAATMGDPPPMGNRFPYKIVLAGRERTRALFVRYADDPQVRCAWLGSEARMADNYGLGEYYPQIKQGRQEIETELIVFLEDVLAGKVKVSPNPSNLRYRLGLVYVDQAYHALRVGRDMQRAGLLFEAGGKHLIMAAAKAGHSQNVDRWYAYNDGISSLPSEQRLLILRRLRDYANEIFEKKAALSEAEMCAYTFVLQTFAEAAIEAKQVDVAVPAFQKYNALLRHLRALDNRNENYEIKEVSGLYSLAEAYTTMGKTLDARQQYRLAIDAASRVSDSSKSLLNADGFMREIREKAQ